LSENTEFQGLIHQQLTLVEGGKRWLLVNDPYDPLTTFSKGNKLWLVDSRKADELAAGLSLPQTPKGRYTFIAIVDGWTIEISRVVEFGMETSHPVVLGRITTRDGLVYPFESEWTEAHTAQIRNI